MFRKILCFAVLAAGSAAANADVIFEEGFDNVPGLGASGWLLNGIYNQSTPGGETSWFQGNTDFFTSQAGAPNSYVAANFLNAPLSGGNIDNWLITPAFYAVSGSIINFSTRTNGALPGDTLELLYNNAGTTNLSDFISLGILSGGTFIPSGVLSGAAYPSGDWGSVSATYYGNGSGNDVRFALRYAVTDTANNGDYIGIDSLSVSVPEPGTVMLLGAGLLLAPLAMRRRRRDQV